MLFTALLTVTLAVSNVVAVPLEKSIFARQNSFVGITGAEGMANREEIRTVLRDTVKRNLFVAALANMQARGQNDQVSYYQLMGIHGLPGAPWGRATSKPRDGYCTHSSQLFTPWHRPYLALYEQELWKICRDIARRMGSQQYINAARSFRLPYWDWASNAAIPNEFMQERISVTDDRGTRTIENPLYAYRFRGARLGTNPNDISNSEFTLRAPRRTGGRWVSDNARVNRRMQAGQSYLRDSTYILLTQSVNYYTFASKILDESGNDPDEGYDSIESIHDQVHVWAGEGGHMMFVGFSAFDPLFMMHHCNVDRLTCMWQTIMGRWVGAQTVDGTNSSTPLVPFNYPNGTDWTSTSCQNWRTLGYDYPETSGGGNVRSRTIEAVNRLYGPNRATPRRKRSNDEDKDKDKLYRVFDLSNLGNNVKYNVGRITGGEKKVVVKYFRDDVGKKYNEYIANLAYKGSEDLCIFLTDKDIGKDTSKWTSHEGYVGCNSVFSTKDRKMQMKKCSGTIPLTTALRHLVHKKKLDNMNEETVKKYLQKHFKYGFMRDGKYVERKDVEKVAIKIVRTEVEAPQKDDELPKYGKYSAMYDPK